MSKQGLAISLGSVTPRNVYVIPKEVLPLTRRNILDDINFFQSVGGKVFIHRQTNRQTERQTEKQTVRQTNIQTVRQREKQTERQTERQTKRQTERQKERQPGSHFKMLDKRFAAHCATFPDKNPCPERKHFCQFKNSEETLKVSVDCVTNKRKVLKIEIVLIK